MIFIRDLEKDNQYLNLKKINKIVQRKKNFSEKIFLRSKLL